MSNTLIMYMISALLFVAFVDLHIHTQETASAQSHGSAVSISIFNDEFIIDTTSDEISVNPESMLKLKQTNDSGVLAVFILLAILVVVLFQRYIGRIREAHTLLPSVPSHISPPLRAPPH